MDTLVWLTWVLFGVFELQSNFFGSCNSYFADAYEAFLCYFELFVDVQLVALDQLMFNNFEEHFPCNWQADSFCVWKRRFIVLNEMAELQLFKRF